MAVIAVGEVSVRCARPDANADTRTLISNCRTRTWLKIFSAKFLYQNLHSGSIPFANCNMVAVDCSKKKLIRGPGCPEPNDRWRARPETRTLSGRIYFPFIRNGTESSRWWSAHQEIRLRRGGKWRRTVACNSIDLFEKLCKAQLSCEMISICKAAPMSIPDECAEIWKQTSTRAPKSSNKLHSKQMFAELFVLWVTLDY